MVVTNNHITNNNIDNNDDKFTFNTATAATTTTTNKSNNNSNIKITVIKKITDCNGIRTHIHLVRKRKLDHLAND